MTYLLCALAGFGVFLYFCVGAAGMGRVYRYNMRVCPTEDMSPIGVMFLFFWPLMLPFYVIWHIFMRCSEID